jgi:hypothetical protein
MFTKKHAAQDTKGNKAIAKVAAKHAKKTGKPADKSPSHTA